MQIEVYSCADDFLEACLPWLMLREDFYNGIISTACLVRDKSSIFRPPYLFFSLTYNAAVVGCAIHVDPDGLLISEVPDEAASLVARDIFRRMPDAQRISGDAKSTQLLVAELAETDKRLFNLEQTWNIYRLDSLPKVRPSIEGRLQLCGQAERSLVREWGKLYAKERPTFVDAECFFLRKLDEELLYMWDCDGPQAIASISAPTKNGIKISAVFTPIELRNCGFATAVVSDLCGKLLTEKYTFITLSAEDGHDSERMYQALGFRQIGTRRSYRLGIPHVL